MLTDTLGWRWIFLLNPIVGGVAVVLTLAYVSESSSPGARAFDPAGQLLFIAGIGALTFALVQAPVDGFSSSLIIGLLVGAIAILALFAWVELRARDPMMDVRVFADLPYTGAIYTVFAVLFCTYGTLLVVTQYFQNVRGYSAELTGLLLLSFSLPTIVMAPVAGRLAARFGGRRPTLAGIALVCLATATLAIGSGHDLGITVAGLLMVGLGAGLSVAPATAVAMASISPDRSGMASGILSAQRALGSTAGFAVMGSLLALVVSAQLPGNLEHVIPRAAERREVVRDVVDASNPQAVPSVIARAPSASSDISSRADIVAAADGAFDDGIRLAELAGLVLALAALVFGWFVFPRAVKREHEEELTEASDLEPAGPSG